MTRFGLTGCVPGLTALMLAAMCAPMRATVPPRVAVRVLTGAGTDDRMAAAMFQELVSTWRRVDVDVLLYAEGLNPRPVATVSLVLSSECPPAALAGSLGWMRFVTGGDLAGAVPIPTLMVSIAATRALVDGTVYRGGPIFQRPPELRRELLARALGRVAAHELGHYLLGSRQHARSGLMRAQFSPADLVADELSPFLLEPPERRMLEARLRDAQVLLAARRE